MQVKLGFHRLQVLLLLLCLCCSCQAPAESHSNTYQRVIAIGDLHGDFEATLKAFQLAGLINHNQDWMAKHVLVVQTGDQLDRGQQELQILDKLEQWQTQASEQASKLVVLNGNHEIMNVMGDFRYVDPKAFQSFEKLTDLDLTRPEFSQIDLSARARLAAFLPGGPLAKKLAKRPVIFQYQDLVFVHGGLAAKYALKIDAINQSTTDWLSGKAPNPPAELLAADGPIWSREFSNPDLSQAPDCKELNKSLNLIQAKHLIIAHTVYQEINAACQGQVWRIDVGMSKAYGGPIQVLEYKAGQFKVLKTE